MLEKLLRGKHPIIDAILDFRAMTKLKSTYADGLVKQIADDGRIHTTFQNMVTATGRLSSTDPNLQNIPVRTELGSEIRKMFVPSDGCVFVDADYSQIELRVLAHIADDQTMQEAFRSGTDIHTATAAQVFGVEPEQVTPLMRRHAKAVNFGIVYGISEFSLADDIGVTRKEARQYIDNYLAHYAGVRIYMHDIVEQAKQDGYVTTLFGRRRELPELKSSNFNIRSFGERVALNTPIQGTAADIIKLAMLRVDAALKRQKLKARLVLQVHDELIVECPVKEAEQVKKIVTARWKTSCSCACRCWRRRRSARAGMRQSDGSEDLPCGRTHGADRCAGSDLLLRPWPERFRARAGKPLSLWLCAMDGDTVAGYVGSQTVLGEADMMNVAVSPAYRRQGIGRTLVFALCESLDSRCRRWL